jgi:ATP synthase protein I
MTGPQPPSDKNGEFTRSVARRAARRASWLRHGGRSLAQNLAMIGALGWLVIAPTLAGVFLGRWLDGRLGSGIFWSGALLAVGVTIGCVLAWHRIQEIQQEED